ncbi:MAG: hypothetical protein ACK5LO_01225 [Leucobacter sp.]
MTKDGRPSRIKDIRLFGSARGYLQEVDGAVAFARRLAWWLNGEGFGIGHDPALYVAFNPELPEGAIEAKPPKFTRDDWWFREVSVGVPDGFPGDDAESIAIRGLIDCLKTLKPDDAELIDRAAEVVSAAGGDCRFLLRVKETSKEITEISTTIGAGSEPSLLYVGLTDRATGAYREAPPVELRFYDDGVMLAGKVKVARRSVDLVSRTSVPARMIADSHGGDLSWHLSEFAEAERPVLSLPLKFR